jgi:6,7-dimethyl-8-ribityllumazine synthase
LTISTRLNILVRMKDSPTPLVIEGVLKANDLRIAIVASRWNDLIVSRLIGGAQDALLRLGASAANLTLVRVPGSFEIPLAAKKLAESGRCDAIICVGAVIRGETPHFDYIAAEVTKGMAAVSLETGVPVAYGIITADTVEQAINRAGVKAGNKGFEAAMAAVEMANLLKEL